MNTFNATCHFARVKHLTIPSNLLNLKHYPRYVTGFKKKCVLCYVIKFKTLNLWHKTVENPRAHIQSLPTGRLIIVLPPKCGFHIRCSVADPGFPVGGRRPIGGAPTSNAYTFWQKHMRK